MQRVWHKRQPMAYRLHTGFFVYYDFFPILKCIPVFSYDYIVHSNVKMSPSPARKSKCTFPVERWLKMGDCNRE